MPIFEPVPEGTFAQTMYSTSSSTSTTHSTVVWHAWNGTKTTHVVSPEQLYTQLYTEAWRAWSSASSATNVYTTQIPRVIASTWDAWNDSRVIIRAGLNRRAERAAPTAEQIQARRIEAQATAEIRRVAISRADALLHSVLTDMQREHLKKHDGFVVRGQSGTLYRIRRGRAINVDQLDARGKVVRTLCAHPRADVPDGDSMVAQKLMLEADEAEFLRIANVHSPIGFTVPDELLAAMVH